MRIVIESPLAGDVQRNYRYLLWCMRAVWLRDGHHAIASHLICPWFMDNPHWFFEDLGISGGMHSGQKKCRDLDIGYIMLKLRYYHPESWAAFMRGEWPPHTQGMVVA